MPRRRRAREGSGAGRDHRRRSRRRVDRVAPRGAGCTDVLLVERAEITSGSTFHSAGLVGQLRASLPLTRMMMHSVDVYRQLQAESEITGRSPGWSEVGSLRIASTPARLEELTRQAGWAKTFGLPMELLGPREARERFPLMDADGVLGRGVAADRRPPRPERPHVRVHRWRQGPRRERRDGRPGHRTARRGRRRRESADHRSGHRPRDRAGRDRGRRVRDVHATGRSLRGRERADHPDGPPVPHHEAARGGHRRPPAARATPTGSSTSGGSRVGSLSAATNGIRPRGRSTASPRTSTTGCFPDDWDRFAPLMANACSRVPALEHAEIVRLINGPEAFTPDNEFILGESEVHGLFVAAGFCAHGIAGAGGVGRVMAEWIIDGEPTFDTWKMDIRRFGAQYRSRGSRSAARSRCTRPTTTSTTPTRSASRGDRSDVHPPMSASPRWVAPSVRRACGSGRTGSSPTRRSETRRFDRVDGRASIGARRSAWRRLRAATRSRSSTRPASRSSSCPARGPSTS